MDSFKFLADPPAVLVVACSDDRYPIVGFLSQRLHLEEGQYFPLRIPGGFAPLAHETEVPHHFQTAKEYLELVMRHRPTITDLIVFGHSRCAFYGDFLPGLFGKEEDDMGPITTKAKILLPQIQRIQLWFAMPNQQEKLVDFHEFSHRLQTA